VTDGSGELRFLNEDGNENQTLYDVSAWLNYFLEGKTVIEGTDGGDMIQGSDASEQILASGGDDSIAAGGADDLVYGSWGNDTVFGDGGNDSGGDDERWRSDIGRRSSGGEDGPSSRPLSPKPPMPPPPQARVRVRYCEFSHRWCVATKVTEFGSTKPSRNRWRRGAILALQKKYITTFSREIIK
jgi:hypothetical protein